MKLRIILALLLICTFPLIAGDVMDQADDLYDRDLHSESFELLQNALDGAGSANEKADLYWRLSRATLEIGDLEEVEGAEARELLDRYIEAESYADKCIELNPDNHEGYYWKSANMGRWGEVKGILNSLFKAKPIRDLLRTTLGFYPEHPASFYVLGILYERVPGRPISFGNKNYSVSLGRKAVDANLAEVDAGLEDEVKLAYHIALAQHLHERNWNASKRNKEQAGIQRRYQNEDNVLEKNFYYEGIVEIENMSDREEAVQLMQWVIREFEAMPALKRTQREDMEKARADLARWTK